MSILNEFFYGNLTPYEYDQSKETTMLNTKVLNEESSLLDRLSESDAEMKSALDELIQRRMSLTVGARRIHRGLQGGSALHLRDPELNKRSFRNSLHKAQFVSDFSFFVGNITKISS